MRTNTLEIMPWISSQVSKVDRTCCGREHPRTFVFSFRVTDALVCKHRLSLHAGEQSVSGRTGAVPRMRHTSAHAAVGRTHRGRQCPVLPQHTPGDTWTAEHSGCTRGSHWTRPLCTRRRRTETTGGDGRPSGEKCPPETPG